MSSFLFELTCAQKNALGARRNDMQKDSFRCLALLEGDVGFGQNGCSHNGRLFGNIGRLYQVAYMALTEILVRPALSIVY